MLILAGCQTTKLSAGHHAAICLALTKSDTLPTLTEAEKSLIRQHFSRQTMDKLKTPQAVMRQIGC
jgi:2-C-methyl-D-erythritol 4-phosphate cytidylyltransferase